MIECTLKRLFGITGLDVYFVSYFDYHDYMLFLYLCVYARISKVIYKKLKIDVLGLISLKNHYIKLHLHSKQKCKKTVQFTKYT